MLFRSWSLRRRGRLPEVTATGGSTVLQTFDFRTSLDGVCVCFSATVEEQVSYGGKVVGESAMVRASDIGNQVKHKYFVSNNSAHV